ncbi:MAG: hypothetical protein MZV64_63860 [Ignavibacteriales bacterium]|nr:hypothetical protein [Ignavibacteriales bacterium]
MRTRASASVSMMACMPRTRGRLAAGTTAAGFGAQEERATARAIEDRGRADGRNGSSKDLLHRNCAQG